MTHQYWEFPVQGFFILALPRQLYVHLSLTDWVTLKNLAPEKVFSFQNFFLRSFQHQMIYDTSYGLARYRHAHFLWRCTEEDEEELGILVVGYWHKCWKQNRKQKSKYQKFHSCFSWDSEWTQRPMVNGLLLLDEAIQIFLSIGISRKRVMGKVHISAFLWIQFPSMSVDCGESVQNFLC